MEKEQYVVLNRMNGLDLFNERLKHVLKNVGTVNLFYGNDKESEISIIL
jgi:hypothetical protein